MRESWTFFVSVGGAVRGCSDAGWVESSAGETGIVDGGVGMVICVWEEEREICGVSGEKESDVCVETVSAFSWETYLCVVSGGRACGSVAS